MEAPNSPSPKDDPLAALQRKVDELNQANQSLLASFTTPETKQEQDKTLLYLRHLNDALSNEIKEKEETYRALQEQKYALDQAAMVILMCEAGRVKYTNQNFCERSGFSDNELLGEMIFSDGYFMESVWKGDIILKQKNKDDFWVNATIVPLMDSRNHVYQYLGILFDVTEQKKAEKILRSESEAKSAFIRNMSHEYRTPLHGMISYSNLALEPSADPNKFPYYFQQIQTSSKRLLSLLNNVLDLSAFQSGKLILNKQQVDFNIVVQDVLDELSGLLDEKKIILLFPAQTQHIIDVDPIRVKQVLVNLIGNAIKYTLENGPIELSCATQKSADGSDSLCFQIKHPAMPIPEEELASLFEPFQQSSVTDLGAGGTGLGLSICREIISAHGGRIWLENLPDGRVNSVLILPI